MVNVRSEKSLGMWGTVLVLVGGLIPYAGSVLALVGFILVLVALHGIGKAVGDNRPFRYYLYAAIVSMSVLIIDFLVFLGLAGIVGTGVHTSEGFSGQAPITPGENIAITHSYGGPASIGVVSVFGILLLVILMAVISAYFEMKAWGAMYEITGTKEFGDAANWFKWGAITAVVILGLLLILVARVLVILGFNNMPEELKTEEEPSTDVLVF